MVRRGKKKSARNKDSNVNADEIPASSRELVQILKEIVDFSEQEIYKMLLECNMDANEAIIRLLSQAASRPPPETSQEVESKGDQKKENLELRNDGNKFNADEMSNVQGNCNHVADSSTTSCINDPQNSDLTNCETNRAPISSGEEVSSLSVPSSSDITKVETKRVLVSSGTTAPLLPVAPSRLISASGQRTMADVVKMSLGLLKENVTNSPVKDDHPLHEKPDVPCSFSDSFIEPDQLRQPASIFDRNLCDDDATYPFSNPNAARSDQLREPASIFDQNLRGEDLSYFSKPLFDSASRRDQLPESPFVSNQNLCNGGSRLLSGENNETFEHNRTKEPSAAVVTRLQQLCIDNDESQASKFSDDLSHTRGYGQEQLWKDVFDEQVNASRNYHSSSDFTFDNSQRLNPAPAPWMHQQAYTREPDPQYMASSSSFSFNRSMPATSLGHRPSISMDERNRQGVNQHYPQPQSPSGLQQHQDETLHTLAAMFPFPSSYRNSNLPQSPVSGTSRGNTRFGYDSVFSNQLPLLQPQNRNSNVWWSVHRNNTLRSVPGHQNQRSSSFRHSQHELTRMSGSERRRRSPYDASKDQQNNRFN